jgi:hypothetical protein
MQMINANSTTNMHGGSVWKWVTWEINTVTYFDTFIGRYSSYPQVPSGGPTPNATATAAGITSYNNTNVNSTAYAQEAWQYGPRYFAGIKGGWGPDKESYPLVPGKHRYLKIESGSYSEGGNVNFSPVADFRTDGAAFATSITNIPSTDPNSNTP